MVPLRLMLTDWGSLQELCRSARHKKCAVRHFVRSFVRRECGLVTFAFPGIVSAMDS